MWLRTAALAVMVLVSAVSAQTWGPPEGSKPTYSVVYTGRLFGYFRFPDIQSSRDQGCPDPATTVVSPQVQLFRSTLERIRARNQELVAMGENFAPELLARVVRNDTPGTPHYGDMVTKDVLPAGAGKLGSDNVACFLRLMGFDAVVPGQQDFYYGPERLREIADLLAEPQAGPYRPVQMLAANLLIGSLVRDRRAIPSDRGLPEEIREALAEKAPTHFNLPSKVMPWLTRVNATGEARNAEVYDCPADPENPRDFKLPTDEENRCRVLPKEDEGAVSFAMGLLVAGSNHALCAVYSQNGVKKTHCQLFSVEYPFFRSVPYFAPAEKSKAVVFGALDPALVGYIGQLNDVWVNTNKRFDTSVEIADPIEALRQALAACDSDSNCHGRRKILLAQMQHDRASELAVRMKVFDLVIAQPDGDHASGNESTSRTGTEHAPYLLTPGVAFDAYRKDVLSTNLRRADFYIEGSERQFIANQVFDTALRSEEKEPCRTCAVSAEVSRVASQPASSSPGKAYEQLALTAMRNFCESDIALLQHRDIFGAFGKAVALWPSSFHPATQQFLDEALWKGDFVFCIPVKGSTLLKVLSESAAFDKQDRDNLSIEFEKGRGLSTLGVESDRSSSAVSIRGQLVQDNKLYGVAMTDYLAFGNTGYPELSSEAIQPVVRLVTLKDLNRVTGLACKELPHALTKGDCQSDEISAADYFSAIDQRPFDTSRGLTAWLTFRHWITHPVETQANIKTFAARKTSSPENVVERRGLWWFTLQNVSLGYNLNFIKGSDQSVPGNFAGNNSFSQLSTPESSQFTAWARAKGGYSFPRFVDFYSSAELKYSRLAVRSSISNGNFGEYQLTLGTNLIRGETGIITKPLTERIPLRLFVSENLLTQATTPFQQLAAPLACGTLPCSNKTTTLTNFDLPKNYLVMTRLGARLQNRQSWFEAGREYGVNIDIPYTYSLKDLASEVPLQCDLTRGLTLSNCVGIDALFTNQTKIIPTVRTQQVAGWFANFHTVVPIWRSNLQLVADSYSELFDRMANDTTYNTRFYEDLTLALKVPVWGNLAFVPQVETFYFQNKVLPDQIAEFNHYVFVTTSLTLQYAFDWHRGVGLVRALRFPNGISTTATETAPRP